MVGRDIFFALMLLASLGLAVRCWVLERRLDRHRRQLAEQELLMQAVVERLRLGEGRGEAKVATGSDAFAGDLMQADLRQRLKGGEPPKKIPERYRLVAAMARRGLSAVDIAEILEMAPGETEQLLKLARVSGEDQR